MRGSASAKRAWLSTDHSVCPRAEKPGRVTMAGTAICSPDSEMTDWTAAAAASLPPRASHRVCAAALSEMVMAAAAVGARSGWARSAAMASGTLLVDQLATGAVIPLAAVSPPRDSPTLAFPPPTARPAVTAASAGVCRSATTGAVLDGFADVCVTVTGHRWQCFLLPWSPRAACAGPRYSERCG